MTSPTPQDLVEHALKVSRADECIATLHDTTSANLRWANNTLTTNGVMHHVSLNVISFVGTGRGAAAGSVTGSVSTLDQVTALVEAADAAARDSGPAEDAAELATGDAASDWYDLPEGTSIEVYADLAPS